MKYFGDMCVMVIAALALSLTFVSCDEHEHIDLDIHPGHILLKSGRVISSADYFANGDSTAIGIVFSEEINESHYLVVSLDELSPLQFCDSLGGMNQGTSCDRTALDGMANTYALQGSMDTKTFHGSPLANAVASSHAFALAEFIPSANGDKGIVDNQRYVSEKLKKSRGYDGVITLTFSRTAKEMSFIFKRLTNGDLQLIYIPEEAFKGLVLTKVPENTKIIMFSPVSEAGR